MGDVSTSLAHMTGEIKAPSRPPLVHRTWWQVHASVLRSLLSLIIVLALWELLARLVVRNNLFLVPLSLVGEQILQLAQSGKLAEYCWVSFQEFAIGFLLASVFGIIVGLLMAVNRSVRDIVNPWVSGLQATPLIALAPLFVLWFGLGILSKVAAIFLIASFAIIINTYTGIATTPPQMIEVVRSFGARRLQIYTEVMIPWALPTIVAGLRLGVARALLGVVFGELISSKAGVGYLILVSTQTYNTAGLFAGVLIFAVVGILSSKLLLTLESRMARWRSAELGD